MGNIRTTIEPQQMWDYIKMKDNDEKEDVGVYINYGDCEKLTHTQLLSILMNGKPEKMETTVGTNYHKYKNEDTTDVREVYARFMMHVVSRSMQCGVEDSVRLTVAGNMAKASDKVFKTLYRVRESLVFMNRKGEEPIVTLEMFKFGFYQEYTQKLEEVGKASYAKTIITRVDDVLNNLEKMSNKGT